MELSTRTTQSKRFVIEDSITKVTADGEPHEMMTLIAGLSGVLAAVIILIILISLVACKKSSRNSNCNTCSTNINDTKCVQRRIIRTNSRYHRSSTPSISTLRTLSEIVEEAPLELTTDFATEGGNLRGNLNAAFEHNEFDLVNSLNKIKKKTRWQDEVMAQGGAKETVIDMPR